LLLSFATHDVLKRCCTDIAAMGWSAAQAAAAFWFGDGRRWREVESGERPMTQERWTLGLLALDRHPLYSLKQRQ